MRASFIQRPLVQMVRAVRINSNTSNNGYQGYPNNQQGGAFNQSYPQVYPSPYAEDQQSLNQPGPFSQPHSESSTRNNQALNKIKKHLQELQDLGEKLKENLKNRLNKE